MTPKNNSYTVISFYDARYENKVRINMDDCVIAKQYHVSYH